MGISASAIESKNDTEYRTTIEKSFEKESKTKYKLMFHAVKHRPHIATDLLNKYRDSDLYNINYQDSNGSTLLHIAEDVLLAKEFFEWESSRTSIVNKNGLRADQVSRENVDLTRIIQAEYNYRFEKYEGEKRKSLELYKIRAKLKEEKKKVEHNKKHPKFILHCNRCEQKRIRDEIERGEETLRLLRLSNKDVDEKDDRRENDYNKDDYNKDDYNKDDYNKDDYSEDDYSEDDYE